MAKTTRWPDSEANQAATLTARAGVEPVVETPRRLPHGHPDGLGVDGGVGDPHLGGLEGGQGQAELLTVVEVLGRLSHGRLGDPDLQCAQPGPGPLEDPAHHLVPPGGVPTGQHVVGSDRDRVEVQVRVDLPVGGERPLDRHPGSGGVDGGHDRAGGCGHRHEHPVGHVAVGDGMGRAGECQRAVVGDGGAHRRSAATADGDVVGHVGQRRRQEDVPGDDPGEHGGPQGVGAEPGDG